MNKRLVKYISIAALSLGAVSTISQEQNVIASEVSVTRISGETRYQTATNISQNVYDRAQTVFIANAMNFADALSGGPLAYQSEAPILLAHGNSLRAETTKEITRLGAKKAVILGGEAAISKSIENELKNLGLSIERLAGETRFETSQIIADRIDANSNGSTAVVVDGYNFADALSIAPFATWENMPIYLTRPDKLPNEKSLKKYYKTYIIGGETAVSKNVEKQLNTPTRIAGANRFQTNLKVLEYFGSRNGNLIVATGMSFADALTGSTVASRQSTGILLTRNPQLSYEQKEYLYSSRFKNITILGGPVSVSSRIETQLEEHENYTSKLTPPSTSDGWVKTGEFTYEKDLGGGTMQYWSYGEIWTISGGDWDDLIDDDTVYGNHNNE
ncbi:cell wall-binding repeat-containing protein [Marinilactibacillus sp. Marseille-P9653]|uniref:cell wall-binding repeat-containing protein n=1 Tax=Marinilactibacillus sp. Marseille-P9653 TaxID=2866583 RepID=UPI001CE47580|nr:cell wall-binding repeat-containing protein [Marinilactibacillus sp. Marseille-P9653]